MVEDSNLERQIIYKLGSIESHVASLEDGMKQGFLRLDKRTQELAQDNSTKLASLEKQVEISKEDIQKLKDWRNTVTAKAIGVASSVTLFWVIFGPVVISAVERIF